MSGMAHEIYCMKCGERDYIEIYFPDGWAFQLDNINDIVCLKCKQNEEDKEDAEGN